MTELQSNHFLLLPRPDAFQGPPTGVPDTTTLAAHDFDVDTRTGFMPPSEPLRRLPAEWDAWEHVLETGLSSSLQLGSKTDLSDSDLERSERWRRTVRELPMISTSRLMSDELLLRRAHHALAWIMHLYIHTLPPSSPILIPPPLTVPLLQVSQQLQIPPILTYSDDVLYNWKFKPGVSRDALPTISNIDSQTLFTGTRDEAEFYLTSARMELKGVEALDLMQTMMDEVFVGDDIAIRRITGYLNELTVVIKDLRRLLMEVKTGCAPQVFYDEIRPWFKGEDSTAGQKWVFEGMELDDTLQQPTELSGASAGQSSLIHSLDVFLGVDQFSHSYKHAKTPDSASAAAPTRQQPQSAFLKRMQSYMPRHHRAFLNHLAANPRPIRDFVAAAHASSADEEAKPGASSLIAAYNTAVQTLKEFRDSHMIIVALYIIGPARRGAQGPPSNIRSTDMGSRTSSTDSNSSSPIATKAPEAAAVLKGTGGTDLVRFLKGVRDQTKRALLPT